MTLYNTNQDIEEAQARFLSNTSRVPYYPISFKRGEGSKLWDEDGKEYIDFLSSACSANIGYGNKELADAIKEQIDNLLQFTIAYFSNATATKFAEKICEITPGFYEKKVSFTCTGSTAIDAAIKFARAYTGRTKLISFAQAYHGSSYGAISVSALSLEMKKKIGPLLPEVYHFEYPICSKCKFGQKESSCNIECLSQMKYAFNHYIPVEEVAAIFIEPIAGDAGIVIPPKKWAKELRNLCDEKGILLVSDEIQQGIGRTGKWFGIENLDIEADILVLGKAIGGGFPLGAVVARKEIMDVLAPPANIYTMAGNPTVCAAGLKTIEIIEKGNILDNVIIMGDYLKEKFRRLQE
ncbi:MAG: aminotransferase class III-fold pyridoxal phosphate-dependent enzyme, partial [Clostridioides sp.]|nr:aminotransferase class III-fold pyridoxal phosphate-dependent enzyme [Clostridioides sp.]